MVSMVNPYQISAGAGLECWPPGRTVWLHSRDGYSLRFVWDGAAYDFGFSRPFLIEAETGPISTPHVQWHLGRLLLMQLCQIPLAGVIWVTSEERVNDLVTAIRPWIGIQMTRGQALHPVPMEIRLPDGKLVRASGGGGGADMRRA